MDDDYGHYGKGITGYVHYTQAQNGGGRGTGIGCGTWFIIFAVAAIILWIVVNIFS